MKKKSTNQLSEGLRKLLLVLPIMLLCVGLSAQSVRLTGKVTDETNEGLPGVSVVVKGANRGASTDVDGNYAINSERGTTLLFSYTGYQSQEVVVGAGNTYDVSLRPSDETLGEVVVTGYGTQSRRNITGSVAVVDTKEMNKYAASNVADQLQGKVAGVTMSTSGDPGSAAFVRIRGIGSINGNEPLYVIDGIPIKNETYLNFLNPNDVESIQVLKDAASASVYGASAGNGVIIITTKKGKLGKSKISFDYWTGSQSPVKTPDLCNPTELLQLNQGLAAGAGIPFQSSLYINQNGTWVLPDYIVRGGGFTGGVAAGDPIADASRYFLTSDPLAEQGNNYLIQEVNKAGTDWFGELFNRAPMSNYQVAFQGGSDAGSYYVSANYYDHEGMLLLNDYKRYQTRVNTQFKIKNRIRVGQHMNIAYQTGRGGIGNPSEGSPLINAYRMPGLVPMRDIKGYYGGGYGTNSNAGNPVANQERNFSNNNHTVRLLGDVYGEIDLLKNLTFKSAVGIDYNTGRGKSYTYRNFEATEVNAANSLNENQFTNDNWVWYNTLRYNAEVAEGININLLAGTEARKNHYIGFNGSGSKLAFGDDPSYRVLGNVDGKTMRVSGYEGENTKSSLLGSADINFYDKYLITATIRRDGSSRFINNRYGVFPGVSVGWRISQENFLKNNAAISDLKLRASYGVTGDDEAGGDYTGYSFYNTSIGEASYDITGSGNSVVPGFHQTGTGNPDLKWESRKMLNLGVDLTLYRKFDVIFEWYNRTTYDMLYGVELPWTGPSAGALTQNIGSMSNKGIDLQMNYRGKVNKDFSYNLGVTFSRYKNEVLSLDANSNAFVRSGGSRIGDLTYTTDSLAIGQFYGYITDGIWESQDEINRVLFENPGNAKPGRFKFRDINGDGQITALDETTIGSPHPDFTYGLNFSANYRSFDFTIYGQGVYGNDIFNYVKYFSHTPAFQANYSREMLYEAGKTLPVLDNNDNYSNQRSSFYVEDGSYFRLKNVQIGYTIPVKATSRASIDRVRVYVQGQNLLTFTKYSGLDPDITIDNITQGFVGGRDYSLGIDRGRYPTARTILFGVNVEF